MNSKLFVRVFFALFLFLVAACSSPSTEPAPAQPAALEESAPPANPPPPGQPALQETPAVPEEPLPVEPFRVAVVMPMAINDLALNQSMYDALLRVQEESGGAEKFKLAYTEGMFVSEDAANVIRDYATQGYDLVIAHGLQYGASLQEIAPEFPETSFAWGTSTDTFGLPNVFAYDAASQEGGYINGVIAAAMSKTGILGVVGPIEAGDTKLYVDGFIAGAKSVNPDITVSVNYIGSFSDIPQSTEAAKAHIAKGADVMTGTSQMVVGAIGVAAEHNALWFGTQSNQTSLAPGIVIANQVYHWEVVLQEMINLIRIGTPGGQAFVINLANGGVVMEYSDAFEIPAIANESVQGIINGSISIKLSE